MRVSSSWQSNRVVVVKFIIMTMSMLSLLSSSGMILSKRAGRRCLAVQAFSTTTVQVRNNIHNRQPLQHHQNIRLASSFSSSSLEASTTSTTSRSSSNRSRITSNSNRSSRSSSRSVATTTGVSPPQAQRRRPFSTSSTDRPDEDLDAALNDILGDVIRDAEQPPYDDLDTPAAGTHMKGSRPVPKILQKDNPNNNNFEMEDNSIDWKDPEQLSTSHPRWLELGMPQAMLDALSEKGITHFTPVQAQAMAPILARRDIIGRSRTGTGKTLAFGMPSVIRIVQRSIEQKTRDPVTHRMKRGRLPSMLVLCPTRELARQVQDELAYIAERPPMGLNTAVFHGGVSYDPQERALLQGVDIVVGTPGRIMDHLDRGNMDLSECDIVVLDEADEMLNMGFAEDVEVILRGIGSANETKTQCLLFSATTPPWVKEIGNQYQQDVLQIDSTGDEGGARVATTVRHLAVQVPPSMEAKKAILEDIIAVEISRDANDDPVEALEAGKSSNPIAAAAAARKKKMAGTMQQKIFGKTIVFCETKRDADDLVSGSVFKSLTAQVLHGDVGQKQRDATLSAFRAGAFNVLVATDVAARGIDIQDVDLVVQLDPPRTVDTYVHRSGRTGRAGKKGVSVLLFGPRQSHDIIRIERDLGHGFKFDLVGPPSTEAALKAAAKTSAIASKQIPEETAEYFKEAAENLLAEEEDAAHVVARCLAAISRRATEVSSRSLLTGEAGMVTVEMSNKQGRPVLSNDVMFTVSKLSRMSQKDDNLSFDSNIGKIQSNYESGTAVFDMSVEDAKRLVKFSANVDADGASFTLLKELEVERGTHFGRQMDGRRSSGGDRGGGRSYMRSMGDRRGSFGSRSNSFGDGGGIGGNQRPTFARANSEGRRDRGYSERRFDRGEERGGFRSRYDNGRGSERGW